ncbi:MAG: hypothetical protein ACI4WT_10725 [Oligosphaeraceae bacterium]
MTTLTDIAARTSLIADAARSLMPLSDLMDPGTRYRLEMMLASDSELLEAILQELTSFRDTFLTGKEDAPCASCRL